MTIKLTSGGSAVFAALADDNRRRVLGLLRARSRRAGEIAGELEITKATLSHHLRVLLAADLVRCERRGRERIYSVNTSVFEDISAALAELLAAPGQGRQGWKRIVRAS